MSESPQEPAGITESTAVRDAAAAQALREVYDLATSAEPQLNPYEIAAEAQAIGTRLDTIRNEVVLAA